MSTRSLVISGAILICLVSYYACFEMRSFPEIQQGREKEERLYAFDRNDIIGMTFQGSSQITLEKQGSFWEIVEPVQSPADQAEVSNLISEILNLRIHRTLMVDGGPDQFGLDRPSLTLTLRTVGRKYDLSIGDKAPASDFYYAKTSGRRGIILLSASGRQYLVGKDLFTLRDKHLVTENFAKADRVRIVRHSMIAEYVQGPEGIWRLSSDNTKRIKSRKVNELIREVCSIEALGYHQELGVSRGPNIAIELSSRGNSQKVKFWVFEGKTYSASDVHNGLFEIDPSFLERIPRDPMEMLDRTIVRPDGEKVVRIVLSGRETKTFTKKRDGWYADSNKMKDSSVVNNFITSLGTIEYQDEYLMLPKDAVREQVIRMTCADSSPFDITVYSKYYVAVDKRIFRVNEGVKKILVESLQSLLREDM